MFFFIASYQSSKSFVIDGRTSSVGVKLWSVGGVGSGSGGIGSGTIGYAKEWSVSHFRNYPKVLLNLGLQ
jgi:hypothetical protein